MSGIVGYWCVAPVEVEDLVVATDLLAHRGPDGLGLLTADDGRLGMGHRRLAILDPSERARQPMVSGDGRYAIVLDGEIYNFLEVRDELRARGCVFRTESDAEVVLHAYAVWGASCQARFNGVWSMAIWDNVARELFLSRDQFGGKPLLVLQSPSGVAFASEERAFLGLRWVGTAAIDSGAACGDLRAIQGGMCATLKGATGPLEASRWWRPLDHVDPETRSYPDQVERFRELLFDACRMRVRSDVPIATAVSGGLDSSATLAVVQALGSEAAARRPPIPPRAFTVVAPGTDHDELSYALAASRAVDVEPLVVDLFARCSPEDMDEYLFLTGGRSLTNLPAWYLFRTMRELGIRASIEGSGADAILVGEAVNILAGLQLEGSWLRHPWRTLDLYRTVADQARDSPYERVSARRLLVASSPILRRIARYLPGLRSRPAVLTPHDDPRWQAALRLPPFNAVAFMSVHEDSEPGFDRYDALSMANGVELRMPFFDWRLVYYALSLPGESMIGHGFTKRILRDAMAPYLPDVVRTRKAKLQFQGPLRALLKGPLRPWLDLYPEVRDLADNVLANGTYTDVRELADRAIASWRESTYPRVLEARIAANRARYRDDPEPVHRHVVRL